MVANGLHRKAVYDEFDGKGLVSSSLTMFLLYSRDLTEKGQTFEQFVKCKNDRRKRQMNDFVASFFKFQERKTTWQRETIGGITSFVTMAYIIFVNPQIMAAAGG